MSDAKRPMEKLGVTDSVRTEPEAPHRATAPCDPRASEILGRLVEVQRELDERKRWYDEYNRLVMELVSLGFVRTEMLDGSVAILKDAFAGGNTAWTSAGVRRFEVEFVSKELQAKREKRAAKAAGRDE